MIAVSLSVYSNLLGHTGTDAPQELERLKPIVIRPRCLINLGSEPTSYALLG